jgi:hypothetical protein
MSAATPRGNAARIGTHIPNGRPSQSMVKARASMSAEAGRLGIARPRSIAWRRRLRASHASRASRNTSRAEPM